ncbi:predicted protein [Uncinocarpus reesii 1704]|uniref:Uncharacterized protein n=1 Tax=Uncinocarpus reesii (strain UAMH 1704) TaxID=336963 RepID=C4JNI3_UNCRE|nr:uncharacterized protein UREG_02981 [Uncinocarpus reesii 1704]EEP78136.1 predicted protein [Uncinocarpus reesii 1704]
MVGFYEDLVASVEGHSLKRDTILSGGDGRFHDAAAGILQRREDERGSLCCRSPMPCLLVRNRKLSFCWDRFTTNYYLPDGSHGSITSGVYTTPSRDTVNLILGNFTLASGSTGNIYSSSPDSKPNLSTLHLPSQFTAKGDGTAIPGSELGAPAGTATTPGAGGPGPTVTVTVGGGAAASATKTADAVPIRTGQSGLISILFGALVALVA